MLLFAVGCHHHVYEWRRSTISDILIEDDYLVDGKYCGAVALYMPGISHWQSAANWTGGKVWNNEESAKKDVEEICKNGLTNKEPIELNK